MSFLVGYMVNKNYSFSRKFDCGGERKKERGS